MGFRETEIDKLLVAARIADSAAAHVRPGAREPENGPAVTRNGVRRAAEVSGLGECARCCTGVGRLDSRFCTPEPRWCS